MKLSLFVILVLILACGSGEGTKPKPHPSPSSTPVGPDVCHVNGVTYCALNPTVQGNDLKNDKIGTNNFSTTICKTGWTATIRPPQQFTSKLKQDQLVKFHLPGTISNYEGDHRIPLELGGHPVFLPQGGTWILVAETNFSDESPGSPNPKDSDEGTLRQKVCAGTLTLRDAQNQLIAKWLGPWPTYKI